MDERRAWLAAAIGGVAWGVALWGNDGGALVAVGALALGGAVSGDARDPARIALFSVTWQALALAWFPETWVAFGGPGGAAATGVVVAVSAVPWIAGLAAGSALLRRGLPRGAALGAGLALATGLAGLGPLPIVPAELAVAGPGLVWPAAVAGRVGFSAALGALAGHAWDRPRAAALLAAAWLATGLAWQRWPLPPRDLTVAVVESGVGAFEARRPSTAAAREARLLAALASLPPVDLIVAPEGAFPDDLPPLPSIPPLIAGAEIDGQNVLLALADGAIADRFAKQHLVPGSERAFLGLGRDRYRAGDGPRRLHVPLARGRISVLPLICYEDLFGAGPVSGADLVVAAAHDGWNPRAAWAHLAAARLVAVETGRWVLRPTPSGHSAAIDPRGRLVWWTPAVDRDAAPEVGAKVGVIAISGPWPSSTR